MDSNNSIQDNQESMPVVPILKERDTLRNDKFYDALKNDESIKRFGRFHFRSRTIWWFISRNGFGSFVNGAKEGDTISRFTHIEFSTVVEERRVLKRIVLGRLLINISSNIDLP